MQPTTNNKKFIINYGLNYPFSQPLLNELRSIQNRISSSGYILILHSEFIWLVSRRFTPDSVFMALKIVQIKDISLHWCFNTPDLISN